jgi:two-component system chemotaxis response regulator CheB
MPKLIALGASTGGTDALHQVIAAFPKDAPPTVVVQHMPEGFTAGFAAWLNDSCNVRVREAKNGDRLEEGVVLVARGGHHLRVRRDTHGLYADVSTGPLIARHRPSVDALFESVAETVGANALGVLLTGMGTDGRDGMLALQNAGATTLAQDEATSVVFGMPKAAIDAGAVDEVVPIHRIAQTIFTPGLLRTA